MPSGLAVLVRQAQTLQFAGARSLILHHRTVDKRVTVWFLPQDHPYQHLNIVNLSLASAAAIKNLLQDLSAGSAPDDVKGTAALQLPADSQPSDRQMSDSVLR